MAKNTKIPPCGARDVTPAAMHSAPVIAPPNIIDGMTRNGSAAANGIAPSEMKQSAEKHSGPAVFPLRLAEQPRPDEGRKRHRQRRHHACGHHRGHDLEATPWWPR